MRKIATVAMMSAAMALGFSTAAAPQSKTAVVAAGPQVRRRRWRKTRHSLQTLLRGPSRLNRSQRWPYAQTYPEARAMSPFPNRPVR